METKVALTNFFNWMKEQGRSPATIQAYDYRLRHFALDYPELPLDTAIIERFLKARKETPAHRGEVFKVVQAFYSYLVKVEGILSPVPSKGKVGRPSRREHARHLLVSAGSQTSEPINVKLVQGGRIASISTSISTAPMVKRFMESREAAGRHAKTLEAYWTPLHQFLAHFPFLPLKYEPIGRWLFTLKIVQRSRFTYRQHIKVFYRWLEAEVLNVDRLFKWPVMEKGEPQRRILEAGDLHRIIEGCRTFQDKCLVRTLIDTKARISEVLSMTRERVWPDRALVDGKEGQREVYLNQATYDMLVQLAPSGPLFLVDGRPMTQDYASHYLHDFLLRLGFRGKKLGPHAFRHAAAVQHLLAGGDLESLRQELGHTNIETTSIYAKLATHHVRERHQELDVLGRITGDAQTPPTAHQVNEKTSTVAPPVSIIPHVPEDEPPEACCFNCHGTNWWRHPEGGWECMRCHPKPPPVVKFKAISLDQYMAGKKEVQHV